MSSPCPSPPTSIHQHLPAELRANGEFVSVGQTSAPRILAESWIWRENSEFETPSCGAYTDQERHSEFLLNSRYIFRSPVTAPRRPSPSARVSGRCRCALPKAPFQTANL